MNRSSALTATIRAAAALVVTGAVLAAPDVLNLGARLCALVFHRVAGFLAALADAQWPQLFAVSLISLLAVAASIAGTTLGQRHGQRQAMYGRRR